MNAPIRSYLLNIADLFLEKELAEKNLDNIQNIINKLHAYMLKETGGDYSFFPLSESLHGKISVASEQGDKALSKLLRDAFKKREKYKRRGLDRYPSSKDYFDLEDFSQLIRTSMRLHYFSDRFPKVKFLPRSKVFTFGSCFAVNIHSYLMNKNVNTRCLPMRESLNSPIFSLRYLRCSYKYDSSLMGFLSSDCKLNTITQDAREFEPAYLKEDQTWLTTRHSDRGAVLKKEICNAEIVIFTVGTALRIDKKSGLETVESQKLAIKGVVNEIQKINNAAHIVLTLSPIPIEGIVGWEKKSSAVEADCVQKSISRVALHELFSKDFKDFENISYFPSFEIVRWLSPLSPNCNPNWQDFHHPNPKIIEAIANIFESVYFKAT